MPPVEPLIINQWTDAMADSPNLGIGLMKNASIDAVQGSVMPNYAPTTISVVSASSTGTFSSGTFTLTTAFASLTQVAVAVTFATTGSLPTGLTAGSTYFLFSTGGSTVKVASSIANALAGTAISLTGNGSGTITVSTVNMGTVLSTVSARNIQFFFDSNGNVWFDSSGRVLLLLGNTTTNSSGKGLAAFTVSDGSAVYLFVYRNQYVDVCNVTTSADLNDPVGNSAWTSQFATMNTAGGSSVRHDALLGQDNIIYACDSRYVNSFQEVPGKVFSPSDATTYTYNTKALTLPANDTAQCLEELGVDLLVGGGSTNLIYPWDRTSPSFLIPYRCPEIGVYGMKNVGNTVYILNGTRGIVYQTTGYLITELRKIPEYLLGSTFGAANLVTWGGIAAKNGALIVGLTAQNATYAGVYMLYPDGRVLLENTPTAGAALPTALSSSSSEFYYLCSPGAIDFISGSRWASFGTVLQSQLYNVGGKVNKATYSIMELYLDQPGAANQQIRVSYRTSTSGSWTILDTYTTDGASTSFDTDIGLENLENIQVQAELSGAGTGSNGLRMRYLRLRP